MQLAIPSASLADETKVNNAARLASPYVLTKDGLETSVAIKYASPTNMKLN